MRLCLALTAVLFFWVAPTFGQTSPDLAPSVTASERARTLGHQALEDFVAGRFEAALAGFRQADGVAHSPVFLLYAARANKELGRFLAARGLYEKCSQETLAQGAPRAWVRAQADAQRELRELNLLIPALRLRVLGEAQWPLLLRFQGREESLSPPLGPSSGSSSPSEFLVEGDPGLYQLRARDQSGSTIEVTVALRVAERTLVLPLHFPQRVSPAGAPESGNVTPPVPQAADAPSSRNHFGAWAAFSASGVALATAGVFAGLAFAKVNAIKERCLGTSCLPQDAPRADAARRFANLATAGLVVSAVGAATGVTLLALPFPEASTEIGSTVRLTTSLQGVFLDGSF